MVNGSFPTDSYLFLAGDDAEPYGMAGDAVSRNIRTSAWLNSRTIFGPCPMATWPQD